MALGYTLFPLENDGQSAGDEAQSRIEPIQWCSGAHRAPMRNARVRLIMAIQSDQKQLLTNDCLLSNSKLSLFIPGIGIHCFSPFKDALFWSSVNSCTDQGLMNRQVPPEFKGQGWSTESHSDAGCRLLLAT